MTTYHTHTYRCRHATGDAMDYLKTARKASIRELGFSDHCPYPDRRWSESRMDMDELPAYIHAVDAAREEAKGFDEPMQVFAGLECEWGPDIHGYLKDELLGHFALDYLGVGIHTYLHRGSWRDSFVITDPRELASFADTTAKALESGIFAFLAHPDLFCYNWAPWDENAIACAKDILEAAQATKVPLEINGCGFRKPKVRGDRGQRRPYPHEYFWDLACEYDILCVVNSDAHRPVDIIAGIEEGKAMGSTRGLKILEKLDLTSKPR
ncbi:MAG: histidinol-phosphatase (PHP family) [Spirochaetes bacterium]|nr:MAG: histidinol-phosphatase (PHP family) [Spirochaetota bacterium]